MFLVPTASSTQTFTANVAGPGYAVGDVLLQNLINNGGTASITWFNLTQQTVLGTNPTAAQIGTNLSPFAPADKKSYDAVKRRWILKGSAIATITNIALIRNTLAVPVKLVSFEMSGVNNAWAAPNTADLMGVQVDMITGGTPTGGTVVSGTLITGSTYSSDANVTIITNYTSQTGTAFGLGSFVLSTPFIGPVASESSTAPRTERCGFLEGLIIPASGMVRVTGLAVGSAPANPNLQIAAVVTEEL